MMGFTPQVTQHRGYQEGRGVRGIEHQKDAGWGVATREPTHIQCALRWHDVIDENGNKIGRESVLVVQPVRREKT
jgi:hypothetical protein